MSGGSSSGRKGAKYERELVNTLRAAGYGALRLPSSGSATEYELPDVLVGRPVEVDSATGVVVRSELWAVELKSGKDTTLYVSKDEVADLATFAHEWGAKPLLGGRSTKRAMPKAHYLVEPSAARETEKNFGLPVADVDERAYATVFVNTTEVSVHE